MFLPQLWPVQGSTLPPIIGNRLAREQPLLLADQGGPCHPGSLPAVTGFGVGGVRLDDVAVVVDLDRPAAR